MGPRAESIALGSGGGVGEGEGSSAAGGWVWLGRQGEREPDSMVKAPSYDGVNRGVRGRVANSWEWRLATDKFSSVGSVRRREDSNGEPLKSETLRQ